MKTHAKALLATLTVCATIAGSANAATLFQENFDGTGDPLNGTEPGITTGGETWTANVNYGDDGSLSGIASATLSFTPVDGQIYTLDASFTVTNAGNNWIGVGFANGESTGDTVNDRFISGNTIGIAWLFARGDNLADTNRAWASDGLAGNTGGADWAGLGSLTGASDSFDIQIILDTTPGAGDWTATYLAKRSVDADYITIRPETNLDSEAINSVGFATNNGTGSLEFFSLTVVPEPGSLALLGLGGLLLARRRRG